jgi:hypothetical protein
MFALPVLLDTDVVGRVAVLEGYNTNTYQAQDNPRVPVVERHPSPFTGLDGNLELRFLGRDGDLTSVNVDGRLNHYEPLQKEVQSDDGAVNAALSTRVTLGPRTTLSLTDAGAVTSFNAAHATDGTMFAFDPTQVRSTYWLNEFSMSLTHQFSARRRLVQSLGGTVSGTIDSAPVGVPGEPYLVRHRGLDYVTPYIQTDLAEDLTTRTTLDVSLSYQYSYQLFVLDFSRRLPRNIGPQKQAFITGLAGWTRHASPELSTVIRFGGVLASPPPLDSDQRAILAPAADAELSYVRPTFTFLATGAYAFGTVNPRLGSGPTATGNVVAIGIPSERPGWRDLALVARAQGSYSSLTTGVDTSTGLGLLAAGAEVRYGVNRWLGLIGGYDVRYSTFDSSTTYQPPFVQQLFYLGLSAYFSTNRTVLPVTTFTVPVQPPS